MLIKTSDFSFNYDSSGNMKISQGANYIKGVMQMLFNMVPGDDPADVNRGLRLRSESFNSYIEGGRNNDYEADINAQINKYTPFIPSNITATYTNNTLLVNVDISYLGNIYKMVSVVDKAGSSAISILNKL